MAKLANDVSGETPCVGCGLVKGAHSAGCGEWRRPKVVVPPTSTEVPDPPPAPPRRIVTEVVQRPPTPPTKIEDVIKSKSSKNTLTRHELDLIICNTLEQLRELNDTKGREYATDDDALANFTRRAEQLDLSARKVWAVFASKHYDAILSFIRRGETLSEPIDGRIDDLILYLILLKGLIKTNV